MNSQTRWVFATLLIIGAVAVTWYRSTVFGVEQGADPSTPLKLVVVTGGSGPYWQMLCNGATAAAADAGVELDIKKIEQDEDIESQMKLLSALLPEDADGVAISPLDAESQSSMLSRLAEKMIVVTVDSDAPNSNRISYVGASNYAAGLKSAQLVQEALPEGGKVAVLLANLTKHNMVERKIGFEEQMGLGDEEPDSKYQVVAFLEDEGNRERCHDQIVELLSQHEDLACIAAFNAKHGPVMLKALQTAGKLDEVKLIAFDAEDATLDGIGQGHIYATVAQDPYQYGYEAVQLLATYCHRDKSNLPPAGLESNVVIGAKTVHAEEVEEFKASFHKHLAGER